MKRMMYMVRACWLAIPLDMRAVLTTLMIVWVSIAIAVWWFDVPQVLLNDKDQTRFYGMKD